MEYNGWGVLNYKWIILKNIKVLYFGVVTGGYNSYHYDQVSPGLIDILESPHFTTIYYVFIIVYYYCGQLLKYPQSGRWSYLFNDL
jgi:hypothetical protein